MQAPTRFSFWELESAVASSQDAPPQRRKGTDTVADSAAPVASAAAAPPSGQAASGGLAPSAETTATGASETGDRSPAAEAVRDFIVFLDDAPRQGGVEQRAGALLRSLGLNEAPSQVFSQLNGFVLSITEQQAQRLRSLGGVISVEADAAVFLEPPIPGSSSATSSPETQAVNTTSLVSYDDGSAGSGEILPWGVRAVWQGEDISLRGNFASDTFAFVIDSGVLDTTGDLNLASTSSWHRSWIRRENAFTDGNGHGSHVAGTIAALANGSGVVGVAPGAQVVSLKVFNSSGGGATNSRIIAAIDHAVAVINTNGLDKSKVVINMSLGGGFSSSLDSAVKNAANNGIRLAVAAGNDGADADGYSPAAAGDHPNVFTVSAVDSAYRMASWSNWDRLTSTDTVDDVDYAAPGVSVLSYYRNGQLASLSGTSMAAPHVAGLLLAGGVEAGSLVTPYFSNTADPFALGVNPGDAGKILWGTAASDVIIGGDGGDRLSGVLSTGTTATAMGAGQVDSLTGGLGADVFVLGDNSRGVFYDDRRNRNLGTLDYATITDFTTGQDKLELRNGSYFTSALDGNLLLFWDRNNNNRLDIGGGNRDEMIAILEGVPSINSSDILWV